MGPSEVLVAVKAFSDHAEWFWMSPRTSKTAWGLALMWVVQVVAAVMTSPSSGDLRRGCPGLSAESVPVAGGDIPYGRCRYGDPLIVEGDDGSEGNLNEGGIAWRSTCCSSTAEACPRERPRR